MSAISLSRILALWADQQPDSVALRHEHDSVSWQELDRRSNRLARAYQNLGVGQDDFVTIGLPNGIEFFEACFATWKAGATPQLAHGGPGSRRCFTSRNYSDVEPKRSLFALSARRGTDRPSDIGG